MKYLKTYSENMKSIKYDNIGDVNEGFKNWLATFLLLVVTHAINSRSNNYFTPKYCFDSDCEERVLYFSTLLYLVEIVKFGSLIVSVTW